MKKFLFVCLAYLLFSLSSCQLVGEIFKAGVWFGVLLVIGIIALIIYLITRGSNKN